MKGKKFKNAYKSRSIRVSDEVWSDFLSYKKRGKSWDLFFIDLIKAINFWKNL